MLARRVHPVRRPRWIDQPTCDHRIAGNGAQLNPVIGQDSAVVLEIVPDHRNRRILEQRLQLVERVVNTKVGAGFGRTDGNIETLAFLERK